MIFVLRRSAAIAMRLIIAGVCCLGIWSSWQLARADYLFRNGTEESLRAAIRLVPDDWKYYMRLAAFDQGHALEWLDTALRLNHYNGEAAIEIGLQYEARGDYARAEKMLLGAFEVDRTYVPRWTLTQYYFHRHNMPAFWAWARSTSDMPADDIRPLFELCWRVAPDPEKITSAVLNDKPELIRQYLGFLLAKDEFGAVALVAPRLVRVGEPDVDRPLLFSAIDRLVAANGATAANALWHLLIDQHWVVADASVPNNGEFTREPLPVSFDWSLSEYPGLHSWPGASGLETEFTGSQPEDCIVAEQVVVLSPGNYTMAYDYHTADIPPDTGIRWQIIDAKSENVLGDSPDLSSDVLKHSALAFSVPAGASLIRLRLAYRRALGTPRISGFLVVTSSNIQAYPAYPNHDLSRVR